MEEAMKNNKIVKKLFAGVMAMSLCLGTNMVAFATETTPSVPESPTVALTKELAIGEGIQTPTVTFTFTFEQDIKSADVTSKKVNIDPVNLKFSSADANEGGKVVKETTNLVAGITWPNAGVYKYVVKETAGKATIDNGNGDGTMTYDSTAYNMYVVVKNGEDGSTVVDKVVVKHNEDGKDGEKANGTPSTSEEIKDTENTDNDENLSDNAVGNDFKFVNTYTKNGGGVVDPKDPTPDQPDPDPTQSALKVTKNVVGDLADKTYGFSFNINLQLPTTETATEFDGYIYNEDGTYVSNKTFTAGSNDFTLAHGQYLTFKELPAGTKYVVTETGTSNYTGETSTIANGAESAVVVTGEKNADVATAQSIVGEKENSTTVKNTYDDQAVTPTGIIVNNLPYVALIVVAIAGCAVIVIGKKRRAA